jgi:hypothetical protein
MYIFFWQNLMHTALKLLAVQQHDYVFFIVCDKFMPKNPHKEPMNTSSEITCRATARLRIFLLSAINLCSESVHIFCEDNFLFKKKEEYMF